MKQSEELEGQVKSVRIARGGHHRDHDHTTSSLVESGQAKVQYTPEWLPVIPQIAGWNILHILRDNSLIKFGNCKMNGAIPHNYHSGQSCSIKKSITEIASFLPHIMDVPRRSGGRSWGADAQSRGSWRTLMRLFDILYENLQLEELPNILKIK